MTAFTAAHRDDYAGLTSTKPDDAAGGIVLVVGTVLDPGVARQQLRTVVTGNLCVLRVPHSRTALDRVAGLVAGPDRVKHGGFNAATDLWAGTVDIGVVAVDDGALAWLREIDAGSGILAVAPLVRPLR